MSETPSISPDFGKWLDGLGAVEEDHVFTPVGGQTVAMTALLNERAAILKQAATGHLTADDQTALGGGDAAVGEAIGASIEKAVGASYTDALKDVDARIAAQLDTDHPDAPRFRLRGISDDDYAEVQDELQTILDGGKVTWTRDQMTNEGNMRLVARAVVIPAGVTLQDVRLLRKKLNRGEWQRLLEHVTRLAFRDAEATDLPN